MKHQKKQNAEKSEKENSPERSFAVMTKEAEVQQRLQEKAAALQAQARKAKAQREKSEAFKIDRSRPGGEKRMERSVKVLAKNAHRQANEAANVATAALKLFGRSKSTKQRSAVTAQKKVRHR